MYKFKDNGSIFVFFFAETWQKRKHPHYRHITTLNSSENSIGVLIQNSTSTLTKIYTYIFKPTNYI